MRAPLKAFPEAHPAPATARIGIIGGGQLAIMTAQAAHRLGCEVLVLDRDPSNPGTRLLSRVIVGHWEDPRTLAQFASQVDVLTYENEFVDAGVLRRLEDQGHTVFPTADCLAVVQDKLTQKETLLKAGLDVARFRAVASAGELAAAGDEFRWPVVLKTRRNGYDGKGNVTVRTAGEAAGAWARLNGDHTPLLVEAFWPFAMEIAVIVTRGRHGETATYPVVESVQRDHVCRRVTAPAAIPAALAEHASRLARRAVEAVGGIGSFGVELFLAADGGLAINELAPRVHNSGHYTIEACECSQFENHVRAILGWPLGSPRLVAPAAAMVNLLGTREAAGLPAGLGRALTVPGARVHLYGKAKSGPGRKMGHVTALGASAAEARTAAEEAAQAISF